MNVLFLSRMYPKFYDRRLGSVVESPIRHLTRMGCNIQVVSPVPFSFFPISMFSHKWKAYSLAPEFERYNGVDIYQPKYLSFPRKLVIKYSGQFLYYGVRAVVEKLRKDFSFMLIHAHMAMPDGYAAMLLSERYNVPFVVTARGTDLDITARLNSECFADLVKVFSRACAVVLPSKGLQNKLFAQFGIQGKCIPNAINPECVFSGPTPLKEHYSGKIILLSVGRLIPTKGIDLNLLAMKQLLPEWNKLIYLVIGNGPELPHLRRLVKILGIEAHVEFLGDLPYSSVMEYMSICDVFSLPSWQETFGLVYLEAMAHGKPVVGCEGQGIDTVIQDSAAGLLAKPQDVPSLVNALGILLEDQKEAHLIGERGRAVVFGKYTWAKYAADIYDLYKSVIPTFKGGD